MLVFPKNFCFLHPLFQVPNIGLGIFQQCLFFNSLSALINGSGVDVAVMV